MAPSEPQGNMGSLSSGASSSGIGPDVQSAIKISGDTSSAISSFTSLATAVSGVSKVVSSLDSDLKKLDSTLAAVISKASSPALTSFGGSTQKSGGMGVISASSGLSLGTVSAFGGGAPPQIPGTPQPAPGSSGGGKGSSLSLGTIGTAAGIAGGIASVASTITSGADIASTSANLAGATLRTYGGSVGNISDMGLNSLVQASGMQGTASQLFSAVGQAAATPGLITANLPQNNTTLANISAIQKLQPGMSTSQATSLLSQLANPSTMGMMDIRSGGATSLIKNGKEQNVTSVLQALGITGETGGMGSTVSAAKKSITTSPDAAGNQMMLANNLSNSGITGSLQNLVTQALLGAPQGTLARSYQKVQTSTANRQTTTGIDTESLQKQINSLTTAVNNNAAAFLALNPNITNATTLLGTIGHAVGSAGNTVEKGVAVGVGAHEVGKAVKKYTSAKSTKKTAGNGGDEGSAADNGVEDAGGINADINNFVKGVDNSVESSIENLVKDPESIGGDLEGLAGDFGDSTYIATQGMQPELSSSVKSMFAVNKNLRLNSGYRTRQQQQALFDQGDTTAMPGTSLHEKGLAADIGPRSQYGWLAKNAKKFGLHTPPGEPWHVQAGSTKHNPAIKSLPGMTGKGGIGDSTALTGAVSYAEAQQGTPYSWGGGSGTVGGSIGATLGSGTGEYPAQATSTVGFDCSGLVQSAFASVGIQLPRNAQAQYNYTRGNTVSQNNLQPGDLLFFGQGPGAITHVGIYVGNGNMIDSPETGQVVQIQNYTGWADFVAATRPGGKATKAITQVAAGGSVTAATSTSSSSLGSANPGDTYGSTDEASLISSLLGNVGGSSTYQMSSPSSTSSTGTTTAPATASGASSPTTAVGGNPGGGSALANQQLGQQMAKKYGWGSGAQWTALNNVVMAESGWNASAQNPTSSAYGIAQNIQGLAGYGTNGNSPAVQISWLLSYIKQRYQNPEAAWAHEQADHWYKTGSWEIPNDQLAQVHKGEMIIPAKAASAIRGQDQVVAATAGAGKGITVNGGITINLQTNTVSNAEAQRLTSLIFKQIRQDANEQSLVGT